MCYQRLTLVGNLGRDPELRYTPSGSPVASFSLAINRKSKDGGDVVTWFRVSVWGSSAEACNQYLSKGRQVLVEGELRGDENGHPRTWLANDGTTRSSFEVTAHVVKFLQGGRPEPEEPEPEQEELPF